MQLALLLSVAVAAGRSEMTYVGGCTVKGPGAVQTAAGGGADGTVAGQAPAMNVYKDGFWSVGCKGDAMIRIGDKYGGGKFKYDVGRVANTSVVLYDHVVESDSQVSMTPSVCFDFCRTMPDMNFFGLIDGRTCYCEHYYMTSTGEGTCDLPCEGDSASICGGSDMSSLYQMHACEGGLAADADALQAEIDEVYGSLSSNYDAADEVGNGMQSSGDTLESYTEGCASDYAQQAKVAAGPILHAGEELAELMGKFDASSEGLPDLTADLGFEERKKVEQYMELSKELMDASDTALAASKELTEDSNPSSEGEDAGSTFVPVLRQMGDPAKESHQAVCGGSVTGLPKVGLSYDQCAHACDTEAPKSSDDYCWAFQYFEFPDAEPLCFLLSDLAELTSFACETPEGDVAEGSPSPDGFLQKKHRHHRLRKHHHKHHHKRNRHVRKASAHSKQHQLLKALTMAAKERLSGAFSTEPQAYCAVRFADVQGVTPEFKDGQTTIDRCFGQA